MTQYIIIVYDSVQYDGLWLSRAWHVMTQYSMMSYAMVQYDRLLLSTV